MKTFIICKKFFAMEGPSLLSLIFLTCCFTTTTGIAVGEYHQETLLLKKGTENTGCHLVWLKNPNSGNASSSDLLLTSAYCLMEKVIKRRNKAYPLYLPNPSVFSISSVKYDVKWNEIDRIDVGVKNVILHPKVDFHMDDFDIAVVKLEAPIDVHDQLVFDVREQPSALSRADNCSVTGQIGKDEQKRQIHLRVDQGEDTTLIADLPSALKISYLVPLGTPLICTKNQRTIVRGLTIIRRKTLAYINKQVVQYVSGLTFISPAAHKDWILATANKIDHVKKPFHRELNHKSTLASHTGLVPLPDHVKLLDDQKFSSDDDAVALWYKEQVHSKIHVVYGLFDLTNARGYTKEVDEYRCAVACFKWNNGHPCSYDFSKNVCYFASKSEVKMAYEEGISIFFQP